MKSNYTKAERNRMVQEVIDGKFTLLGQAKRAGVHYSSIVNWRKAYYTDKRAQKNRHPVIQVNGQDVAQPNVQPVSQLEAKLAQLRKEIATLEEAQHILNGKA